ncbi:proto-oncogene Mas-like [Candoia aspera]|uniref:proto-oncogene Mas-like n=1 Tax=Candoia aspera TaxID=51853 RepID=UPI002FD7B824
MEYFNSNVEAEESPLSSHFFGAVTKEHSLEEKVLIVILPICILGFIGNTIILWLLCCRLRIKLSLYFVCVAVSNIVLIFCSIVDFVLVFTSLNFSLVLQRILHILHLSSYYTGFYIVTTIAAERWCTHFFPVWYKQHRPKNFSAIMSLSLWGFSGLASFLRYYACPSTAKVHFHNIESCRTSSIIEIVTGIIFLPSMIFFTLGIWMRIQMRQEGTPLTRLDITIVAVVLLLLMLNVPPKVATILKYWVSSIDGYMLGNICILLDSISSSVCPLVYLLVGCWKTQKSAESFLMFLEIALSDERAVVVKTQAREEHA